MKKLLLIPILFIFLGCCSYGDTTYNNVTAYTPIGGVVDFTFTYNNCSTCDNSFTVRNNSYNYLSYNFSIYQGGIIVYSGYFNLGPGDSKLFNNAFYNCYSGHQFTEVYIY